MKSAPECIALIPAAGHGSRMASEIPKQYLELHGHPLIWHTLRPLAVHPAIKAVYVVLAPDDRSYAQKDWRPVSDKIRLLHCGGSTRAESVLNGLKEIAFNHGVDDWVLVHDAARPCLNHELIDRLISTLISDDVGGLLAMPVADTLKRATDTGLVAETVDRQSMWQAQTPQMFKMGLLTQALENAGPAVTDESSAIEALGYSPRLVVGDARNFKVTYPHDLSLAKLLLDSKGVS